MERLVRLGSLVVVAAVGLAALAVPADAMQGEKRRPRPSSVQQAAKPLAQDKVQAALLTAAQAAAAAGYSGSLSTYDGGPGACEKKAYVECEIGWTPSEWFAPFPQYVVARSYATAAAAKAGMPALTAHWAEGGWAQVASGADLTESTMTSPAGDQRSHIVAVRHGRNVGIGMCVASPIPADPDAVHACAIAVAQTQAKAMPQ